MSESITTVPIEITDWKFEKNEYPILQIAFRVKGPNATDPDPKRIDFNLSGLTYEGGLERMKEIGGVVQVDPTKGHHTFPLFVLSPHTNGIKFRKTLSTSPVKIIDYVTDSHLDEWTTIVEECLGYVARRKEWDVSHLSKPLEAKMNIAQVEMSLAAQDATMALEEWGKTCIRINSEILALQAQLDIKKNLDHAMPGGTIKVAQRGANAEFDQLVEIFKDEIYPENSLEWPYPDEVGAITCVDGKIEPDLIRPEDFDNEATQKQVSNLKEMLIEWGYAATLEGATNSVRKAFQRCIKDIELKLKVKNDQFTEMKECIVKKNTKRLETLAKYTNAREAYNYARKRFIAMGKVPGSEELGDLPGCEFVKLDRFGTVY